MLSRMSIITKGLHQTPAPCNSPIAAPLAFFHRLPLDDPFPLEALVCPENLRVGGLCSSSNWRSEDVMQLRVSESNLFLRDIDQKLNSILITQSSTSSSSGSWGNESTCDSSVSGGFQFPYLLDNLVPGSIAMSGIPRQESPEEITQFQQGQGSQTCFRAIAESASGSATNLKANQCKDCHRQFRRKQDLKRHERIHSNLRPFVCVYCNQTFSRRDAQKRHSSRGKCVAKPAVVTPESPFNAPVESEGYGSPSSVSSLTPSLDPADLPSDNHSPMCHPLTPLEHL